MSVRIKTFEREWMTYFEFGLEFMMRIANNSHSHPFISKLPSNVNLD